MNNLTLELQILAITELKNANPSTRVAITSESVLLLGQRHLSTVYMDTGQTKSAPGDIQKLVDESITLTTSDNGMFVGGIMTDGNIFLWDKIMDIHRIVNGMPMLSSFHNQRISPDAGLSLPFLGIGDTGFHLIVLNSDFQFFVWEASDLDRHLLAHGLDQRLRAKEDSKGVLMGSWSLVSRPPEVRLPSFGDKEASVHSIFTRNSGTYGFYCLCSVVIYDSNTELCISTLLLQFDDRRTGSMQGFEGMWKRQSHPLGSILRSDQSGGSLMPVKETGALLARHSKDGQIVAVSLNRESNSQIVFFSSHLPLVLGRADVTSGVFAHSWQRQHWTVGMEWTPEDLFVACLTGDGCVRMFTRTGDPVTFLARGHDFNLYRSSHLTLHAQPFGCLSLAVRSDRPVFISSDGCSVSAFQVMTQHTCLSLMHKVNASVTLFFQVLENKFSFKTGKRLEGICDAKPHTSKRLLGGTIPCEPFTRSEVKEVFRFEAMPGGSADDLLARSGAVNRKANFPESGRMLPQSDVKGPEDGMVNLERLEEKCLLGWKLACSHAGIWTVDHEMAAQEVINNLVRAMQLLITYGTSISVLPTPPSSSSSSPLMSRQRSQGSTTSADKKFNPGLARSILLLNKCLQILEMNCLNAEVSESRGDECGDGNASIGSLINCALLLVHRFVRTVLASPSRRSKVHALHGCYKIVDMAERSLSRMFLSPSNALVMRVIEAKPCLIFSSGKSDLMPGIKEEEEEEDKALAAAEPEKENLDGKDKMSTNPASAPFSPKASLGLMASLASNRKKDSNKVSSMEDIIFRRLSSVQPSSAPPPVTVYMRNVLACIRSRLCASYRLVYQHACRHLERVANECQGRDPEAVKKQVVGTKRVVTLLVCKLEELRGHLVPHCVDVFGAKAERDFLDHELTAAIYVWLNELLEVDGKNNPGRVCRILHSILYTHLSRYDTFGAIQLVEMVVRSPEVARICSSSGTDHALTKDDNEAIANDDGAGKRDRNAEKRKYLRNLQRDVLKLFWASSKVPLRTDLPDPSVTSNLQPMKMFFHLPSKRLFQTLGRFMASYFVGGSGPFVHPPHQPYSLPPLYVTMETVDKERRLVPIQRHLLTKAVSLQRFGGVWTPVRALQYLLLSGLFADAVWFLRNAGNTRAAVSVAGVVEQRRSVVKSRRNLQKLDLPPMFLSKSLLEEMVLDLVKSSLLSDWWIEDSSRLQSSFGSIFLASAVCNADVLSPTTRRMMRAVLQLVANRPLGSDTDDIRVTLIGRPGKNKDQRSGGHFFAHPFTNGDIKSPLPIIYYPQPAISSMDETKLSREHLEELRARLLFHKIFSLVRVVLSSSGCLDFLASMYSTHVVESSDDVEKSSKLLKPYMERSVDTGSTSKVEESSRLLSDFRDLCGIVWMMTLRDRLFVILKEKQREKQKQVCGLSVDERGWLATCRACVQTCMQLRPFSGLLDSSPQLNSLLLSALFELPNDDQTAAMMARCFPRPEGLDPDCRSRFQLKLKEWETMFIQFGNSTMDGSTMAALYIKHCKINSSELEQSRGAGSLHAEKICFPNLLGDSDGVTELRSFEKREEYIQFLSEFLEILLNSEPSKVLPVIPENFEKIRKAEFESLGKKPRDDSMMVDGASDEQGDFLSRKGHQLTSDIMEAAPSPFTAQGDAIGQGRILGQPDADVQGKSLLNLTKFIASRPSMSWKKSSNNNNNNNNDNSNSSNNNDNTSTDDNTNNNNTLSELLPATNINTNNGNNTRESVEVVQSQNPPALEKEEKTKVDFSNKPYLPEEPGNEMKLAGHSIHPAVFGGMDFGPSYRQCESLARWLCDWSSSYSEKPIDRPSDWKEPQAAIKVPIQSKFLVYCVWAAERQELYERVRTKTIQVPAETQVEEAEPEEEEEEEQKKGEESCEIQDASTQSEGEPRVAAPPADVEEDHVDREEVDNINLIGSSRLPSSSDVVTQTDVVASPPEDKSNRPGDFDMLKIEIRDEMKRIVEAQNHGILSILEYLKSSSSPPMDHQQELKDLLTVLKTSHSSLPGTPTSVQPGAANPTNQYAVYAVTLETDESANLVPFKGRPPEEKWGEEAKVLDMGDDVECSLKDVSYEDNFPTDEISKTKESQDVHRDHQGIDESSLPCHNKCDDLQRGNETCKDLEVSDSSAEPQHPGDRTMGTNLDAPISGVENVLRDFRARVDLPKIADVVSELKELIGSQGGCAPGVGRLLRLPTIGREDRFEGVISALRSLHMDSLSARQGEFGSIPASSMANRLRPDFIFPVKLPRSDRSYDRRSSPLWAINNNSNNNIDNDQTESLRAANIINSNGNALKGRCCRTNKKGAQLENKPQPDGGKRQEEPPLPKLDQEENQPSHDDNLLAMRRASWEAQRQLMALQTGKQNEDEGNADDFTIAIESEEAQPVDQQVVEKLHSESEETQSVDQEVVEKPRSESFQGPQQLSGMEPFQLTSYLQIQSMSPSQDLQRQPPLQQQQENDCLFPCPCLGSLPLSDDPIFDDLKRVVHRQVQEHEQRRLGGRPQDPPGPNDFQNRTPYPPEPRPPATKQQTAAAKRRTPAARRQDPAPKQRTYATFQQASSTRRQCSSPYPQIPETATKRQTCATKQQAPTEVQQAPRTDRQCPTAEQPCPSPKPRSPAPIQKTLLSPNQQPPSQVAFQENQPGLSPPRNADEIMASRESPSPFLSPAKAPPVAESQQMKRVVSVDALCGLPGEELEGSGGARGKGLQDDLVSPTNALLQFVAATHDFRQLVSQRSPRRAPAEDPTDVKRQLQRCQKMLEEAKDEIVTLKMKLEEEKQRMDQMVSQPPAGLYPYTNEPTTKNQKCGYADPLPGQLQHVTMYRGSVRDSKRDSLASSEPNRTITMARMQPWQAGVTQDLSGNFTGYLSSLSGNMPQRPPTEKPRLSYPAGRLSKQTSFVTLERDQLDKSLQRSEEGATHWYSPKMVPKPELHSIRDGRLRFAMDSRSSPATAVAPGSQVNVIRRDQTLSMDRTPSPPMHSTPVAGRPPLFRPPPFRSVADEPVAFMPSGPMVDPATGYYVLQPVNEDSDTDSLSERCMFRENEIVQNRNLNWHNDNGANDDLQDSLEPVEGRDPNVSVNNNVSRENLYVNDIAISPKCLRSLGNSNRVMEDMEAKVRSIELMARQMEREFSSARLLKCKQKSPCMESRKSSSKSPSPTGKRRCSYPRFSTKDSPNRQCAPEPEQEFDSIGRVEECPTGRGGTRSPERACRGWMTPKQRRREEKRRMMMLRNMEERCRVAEKMLEKLKAKTISSARQACNCIPHQSYQYDRTSWMKRIPMKPHPATTYVERLQKATRTRKDQWMPTKVYGCRTPADRFRVRSHSVLDKQVTLNGSRYDFVMPPPTCLNFNNNVKAEVIDEARRPRSASARFRRALANEQQTPGKENIGPDRFRKDASPEDSMELGESCTTPPRGVTYQSLVAVEDLESVDGSMVSKDIDWSQVDRIVEQEEFEDVASDR